MENKINIVEILKDCPKGMELDCSICNGVKFIELDRSPNFPIVVRANNGYEFSLTKYGQVHNIADAKCVIFPKGKTTWEGFQRSFEDGDIVTCNNGACTYTAIFKEMKNNNTFYRHAVTYDDEFCCVSNDWSDFNETCRIATEEEKQKLFDAIKANGYKWNEETKTLKKLIEPKFKVGDRIKKVKGYISGIITNISDDGSYRVAYQGGGISYIHPAYQYEWELVPNKFDITTLKPFNKVLIRDRDTDEWNCNLFSYYRKNSDRPYVCIGCEGLNEYEQCIPYEGNEHLLGTSNDCVEYYKLW